MKLLLDWMKRRLSSEEWWARTTTESLNTWTSHQNREKRWIPFSANWRSTSNPRGMLYATTQQEPIETISECVTKLRRLAASCDSGTLKEDMIRDRIGIGTSDEEVPPHLLRNLSLNLSTCIAMC